MFWSIARDWKIFDGLSYYKKLWTISGWRVHDVLQVIRVCNCGCRKMRSGLTFRSQLKRITQDLEFNHCRLCKSWHARHIVSINSLEMGARTAKFLMVKNYSCGVPKCNQKYFLLKYVIQTTKAMLIASPF